MRNARMVYEDSKGGFLVVVVDDQMKGEEISLQKKYWMGAVKELPSMSLVEIEALVLELKDILDGDKLARKLLNLNGEDLFFRNKKGQIARLF